MQVSSRLSEVHKNIWASRSFLTASLLEAKLCPCTAPPISEVILEKQAEERGTRKTPYRFPFHCEGSFGWSQATSSSKAMRGILSCDTHTGSVADSYGNIPEGLDTVGQEENGLPADCSEGQSHPLPFILVLPLLSLGCAV